MNWLDRAVLALAPEAGLKRVKAKRAAEVLMRYDAAQPGRRSRSIRPNALDADGASDRRQRIAFVARDMLRNNPIALRAQTVIVGNVVGDGIIPGLVGTSDRTRRRFEALVKAHCDTTAIDADGRSNLYGLQRLVMAAVCADGEVLIRIRRRSVTDGLPLPFQLQLLEADYLDTSREILGETDGVLTRQGIEYDSRGRRLAYWLYDEHPGSTRFNRLRSRRVPASEVIHVFRQDRPGQQRGVSWLAPVAMQLQDLADYLDAQLVRQKIAACLTGFRFTPDGEPGTPSADPLAQLKPGAMYQLAPGEDIKFSDPPQVTGLSEFTTASLRAIASGMGITYEALTGDLGGVNYSSGRMGRMEMDRNVSAWQWLMLIPQMMNPVGRLILDSWSVLPQVTDNLRGAQVTWTPPARVIVDPAKEYAAMQQAVRAGFRSWSDIVRGLGYDPEDVAQEIAADAKRFDRLGLTLDSDPRFALAGGGLKLGAEPAPADEPATPPAD